MQIPEGIKQKVESGEKLSFKEAMLLLDLAHDKLVRQRPLVKVKLPVVIVGDTHGDFETSVRVFERYKGRKLFLGDFVDRGDKQLENVNFLLAKLVSDEVVLLRGNHESQVINYLYGFADVLVKEYDAYWLELYVRYNEVFSLLPYAAKIKKFLALHGGLPQGLKKVKQIEKIPKKDMIPRDEIAYQLLWNDPSLGVKNFATNELRGGGAMLFGKEALKEFLKKNGLKGLIRAHEPKEKGYEFMFKDEKGGLNGHLLLTVFSCRYYGIEPAVAILEDKAIRVENI